MVFFLHQMLAYSAINSKQMVSRQTSHQNDNAKPSSIGGKYRKQIRNILLKITYIFACSLLHIGISKYCNIGQYIHITFITYFVCM